MTKSFAPQDWRTAPSAAPGRRPTFELAVLAVIVVWNVAANLVIPDALRWPFNLAVVVLLVTLARRGGAGWSELGLDANSAGRGLRMGLVAVLVIGLVVVVGAAVPWTREIFDNTRFVGVGLGEMLYQALVDIPLGTAVAEEVVFRGVVLGLLLLWTTPLRAALLSSFLFGLWHILPGLAALDTTSLIELDAAPETFAVVSAQVIVSGLAGLVFAWLRLRSGSVVAPTLAHIGLNSTSYIVGWLVVTNGWS